MITTLAHNEYTFRLGDVSHDPGLYLSWLVRASSDAEAVEISRRFFAETSQPGDPELAVEPVADGAAVCGFILRADPDRISTENIIDRHVLQR